MENVITFMRYWYLIKRTTNSAGIRANWINCVLYKVLLNLHFFPVLNVRFSISILVFIFGFQLNKENSPKKGNQSSLFCSLVFDEFLCLRFCGNRSDYIAPLRSPSKKKEVRRRRPPGGPGLIAFKLRCGYTAGNWSGFSKNTYLRIPTYPNYHTD